MSAVFADSLYWVALLNPRDQWRDRALAVSKTLGERRIITTEEVLVETLGFLASRGPTVRRKAAQFVREMRANPGVEILPQSTASFRAGMELYDQRQDKEYSLVDCISMLAMRERSIAEALTHDQHFVQEGFRALLRE